MIKSKQGAEMALNIVIIAAIALIVLVVVIYIFGSRSSEFTKTAESCTAKFGKCVESVDCKGPTVANTECDKKEPPQVCCLLV